jgi:hypothetical protein
MKNQLFGFSEFGSEQINNGEYKSYFSRKWGRAKFIGTNKAKCSLPYTGKCILPISFICHKIFLVIPKQGLYVVKNFLLLSYFFYLALFSTANAAASN